MPIDIIWESDQAQKSRSYGVIFKVIGILMPIFWSDADFWGIISYNASPTCAKGDADSMEAEVEEQDPANYRNSMSQLYAKWGILVQCLLPTNNFMINLNWGVISPGLYMFVPRSYYLPLI